MAKARVSVSENPEDDVDAVRDAQEFAELNQSSGGDLFAAVDELRSAGAAGIICIVYRHTPVEQKGYCGKIPISEFDLERLKSLYGSGKYMVQIKGPKGFLPGGGPVEIAPTVETAKLGNGGLGDVFELMERKESERRARTDDWLKLALTALTPVIAAWVSRPAQGNDVAALVTALKPVPGPSLADLSQVMVNMKTMTQPVENSGGVDTVLKVFEAAQGMMGDKEGGGAASSSWIDIVRDLIKAAPDAVKPLLAARMAQMQAGGKAPPVSQVHTPVQQQQPVPPVPSNGENPMNLLTFIMPKIREGLAMVVSWAQKDRDPSVYADVLVDELPDNFGHYITIDKLLEYFHFSGWFEKVCEIEPRLAPYRDWCDECRLAMIEIFREMQSGEEPAKEQPAPKPNGTPSSEVSAE